MVEQADFKSHEENHRAVFASEVERRGLKKGRSYWMCAVGGYGLGVLSGLLGEKASAATTIAIEPVVIRHLHQQLDALGNSGAAATSAILQILKEEQYHHDQSAIRLDMPGLLDRVVDAAVATATEAVIFGGMPI